MSLSNGGLYHCEAHGAEAILVGMKNEIVTPSARNDKQGGFSSLLVQLKAPWNES
jgi:hypothetical protein